MLKRLTPFFNADGQASAASESGDWGSFIQSMNTPDGSANDEQPETDSDAETLETADMAEEQDAAGPDSDEADTPDEKADDKADMPAFNDDTDVDLGEGRQPVKLAELKQGYLRQSDYTKKTQELATQRKELDSERAQLEPIKGWLDFATSNPYLWSQLNQTIQQWQTTGHADFDDVMQDANYAKWINGYQAELIKVTKERDDLKSKYGDLEFGSSMDKTMSELKADYGELITPEYEAELRDQAKKDGLSVDLIKKIAKGDLAEKKLLQTKEEVKKTKKQTEANTIQKLQEQRRLAPPSPKSNGNRPASQQPDIAGMGWLDLAKHAGSI